MHLSLALPWLIAHIAELSRLSSAMLIAAVWQGILLAAIAGLALRFLPDIPAGVRFAIWLAVFALIAALPFLPRMPHAEISIVAHTQAQSQARSWFSLDSRWTFGIAALWAVASIFRAATLIAAALRVRTLSRKATPIEVTQSFTPTSTRHPQVCSSADVDRPTVIGFFSPKILIPAWLVQKLTATEIEHVILHESSHLHRADDWLNLMQKLALVIFPLNPALAWVERRLCFERELACDERVLRELGAREDSATGYASSLATLAEYRLQHRRTIRAAAHGLALALGALGRESELGRRVHRILRPAACMKPLHVRIATAAALLSLLFATTQLERCPQLVSFTAASPSAQLASAPSSRLEPLLDGAIETGAPSYARRGAGSFHAIALPETAQPAKPTDAGPRAIAVRDTVYSAPPSAHRRLSHLIAAREPQDDIVITRWTVLQGSDGYRVVHTSAMFTSEPDDTQITTNTDAQSAVRVGGMGDPPRHDAQSGRATRFQHISQPYAAVPVPGGWLVFQL